MQPWINRPTHNKCNYILFMFRHFNKAYINVLKSLCNEILTLLQILYHSYPQFVYDQLINFSGCYTKYELSFIYQIYGMNNKNKQKKRLIKLKFEIKAIITKSYLKFKETKL